MPLHEQARTRCCVVQWKFRAFEGSLGLPQASLYKTPNGVVFSFLFPASSIWLPLNTALFAVLGVTDMQSARLAVHESLAVIQG